MSPCPRCHGAMFPTYDGDLRCLMCGEVSYGPHTNRAAIYDVLAASLELQNQKDALGPGDHREGHRTNRPARGRVK
jgi:hypothetical protein